MKKRFRRAGLGAVAAAAVLAVLPAAVAAAQAPNPMRGPAQAGFAPAAARQRTGLAGVHLVTGVVRNQAGRALSGVCVLAAGPGGGQVRITRTPADGRYELSLPRAGEYTLQYRDCQAGASGQPAIVLVSSRQIRVEGSPLTSLPATTLQQPGASSGPAALAAAGIVIPQHMRILRLAQAGAKVAGEPASSGPVAGVPPPTGIAGKVTGPAGHPLANVCVWVVGNGFAAGTTTSRHGTYLFVAYGFTPGRYPVEFTATCQDFPFGQAAWAPEWYKNKFAQSRANKVRLRAGKVAGGINAVMQPAGAVSGVVTGSDGRRIKNACAVLTTSAGVEVGQAVTSAKGSYEITGLDPGSYRLVAVAACTGGASDYGSLWYPSAQTIVKARPVVVRLGHVTSGINVVLPKLGTISGVIRLGGKSGKPLGGMCVGSFSPTNSALPGGGTNSRRNGTYVMEGLTAGQYEVDASTGCGNNGNYAQAMNPRLIRVSNGKTVSGVNVYMQPGGILSGTVTDAATHKLLAGICVSDDSGDFAVTASNGTYTMEQLTAGRTTVTFGGGCGNTGSYAPQYYDGQSVQEAAKEVTITAGHATTDINAAMLPGATISGKVTRASGRPVRGVCVSPVPANLVGTPLSDLGADATSSRTGSYTISNLAPGQYAVAFYGGCDAGNVNVAAQQWFKSQPTYNTAGLISAQAGMRVSGIDAVVTRGGTIAGTVTDAMGQPLDFACVSASSRSTGLAGGDQTFSFGGQYSMSGLAPGQYTIVASNCSQGNLADSRYRSVVIVRAGRTTSNINLVLPRGGVIAGKVTVAATGRPARDVCVSAFPAGSAADQLGYYGSGGVTNAAGKYRITGLATGRYKITVQTGSGCGTGSAGMAGEILRGTVHVTQGKQTSDVNASLRPGGSIAGQVTGPGAQDVPGACVAIYRVPGGLMGFQITDAHGKYARPGLAAGRYKVEFIGYCSDAAIGLGVQWYNGASSSGSATIVTVRAGHTTTAINASLPAAGTITGSVTGTGSVPLTGVCVSAVPVSAALSTVYAVTSTGSYALTDLPPGQYRVEFQAGCGRSGLAAQWWDDALSAKTAKIVTVGAGSTISGISAVMTSG